MKIYLIIRQVQTVGNKARIKSKVYITFWNGAGFGCRRFAKEYKTLDESNAGACEVAAFFYRPSGLSYKVDMEVVEETTPGEYKSAKTNEIR